MNISMNNTLKRVQFAQYQKSNQNKVQGKGSFLYEKATNSTTVDSHRTIEQSRLNTYDAYCSMRSSAGNKISFSNLGVQVSGNLDAAENDKYAISVYTEEGVKGHWRVYNKETGTTMSFDPKLTSIQIDPETGKKYLTETDWFGGFMGAWGVDSSLEELLGEFMDVDELQCSDINDYFTLDKDATTGIVSIKRKGAEGNGASMILEDEEQAKKLEELADLYLEKYPSLVTTKEMALHFAKCEIIGTQVRDETGVLSIGTGGMVYYNAQDPTKSWGILYSGYDSSIYSKIKEAFVSGSITGNLISDYEKWVEWLTEKEIDFELTTGEEDLERLREENYSEWLRITSSLHSNKEELGTNELPEQEGLGRINGNSFWDLINSGAGRRQIPTVNQIVNAKNPKDGKIYITYFMDKQISCNDATGNRVWDIEINEQEEELVTDFFSNYKPTRDIVKEYYNDPALGQVSSKDFWLSLFESREE